MNNENLSYELNKLANFCKRDMYGYQISFKDDFGTDHFNNYELKRIGAYINQFVNKFIKTREFDCSKFANGLALLVIRTLGNRLPDIDMYDRIIDIAIKKEIYKTVCFIQNLNLQIKEGVY